MRGEFSTIVMESLHNPQCSVTPPALIFTSRHFLALVVHSCRNVFHVERSEAHELGARAAELVDSVDEERAAFIKTYFHAEWPNRSLYHAMINTDLGEETVIQAILSFIQRTSATQIASD